MVERLFRMVMHIKIPVVGVPGVSYDLVPHACAPTCLLEPRAHSLAPGPLRTRPAPAAPVCRRRRRARGARRAARVRPLGAAGRLARRALPAFHPPPPRAPGSSLLQDG